MKILVRTLGLIIFLIVTNTSAQKNCESIMSLLQSYKGEQLLNFEERNLYYLDNECEVSISKELRKRLSNLGSKALRIYVHRLLSVLNSYPDNVQSSDSVLRLIDNKIDHPLYSKQYYTKGAAFYNQEKPINSMRAFIEGYKRAKKTGDKVLTANFLNAMGSVKGSYSKDYEAVLLHKKALEILENNPNIFGDDYVDQLLICIDNIAIHHLEYGNTDSSLFYVKKAKSLMEASDVARSWEVDFKSLEGQINYYMGNYYKSKEILYAIDFNETDYDYSERLYYIGMSEGYLGNIKLKDSIFEVIYELCDDEYTYTQSLGNVYQYLLERAIEVGDKPSQLSLARRKKVIDSIEHSNEIKLQFVSSDDFSVSKLLNDKQILEKEIKKKNYSLQLFLTLLLVSVGLLVFLNYRYRLINKRLKKVLKDGVFPKISSKQSTHLDQGLESVLKSLNRWEFDNGFLDNSITQQTLAKRLGTNDTYLSKTVNNYKNQSFPDYLKDIRITHLINDLRKDPSKANRKSLIQIAEMYGFSSVDVFRRAMFKKLNVSPSKFLKELKTSNL